MTTYIAAYDQMHQMFTQGVNAGASAILGYVPEMRFLGVQKRENPPTDKFWIRFTVVSLTTPQSGVGVNSSQTGSRKYTDYGYLMAEVFCPKSSPTAWRQGQLLATMIRDLFRGTETEGCVWFRNPRINPIDPVDNFYRLHVIADYEYDDHK